MNRRCRADCRTNAALATLSLFAATLVAAGCAGQTETVVMQQPGAPPQQMTIPKATLTGAASGAQFDALAQAVVDANNNASLQVEERYQSARIIAAYNTSDLPAAPAR